jgi:hypothetical protein
MQADVAEIVYGEVLVAEQLCARCSTRQGEPHRFPKCIALKRVSDLRARFELFYESLVYLENMGEHGPFDSTNPDG